ncbi:MAG: YkgJ family cysteine cluster protein [Desulfovibrio sp.]|nr:YkgJ family cysteine cluster protein [Desulfovibrio sp.]
MIPDLSPIFSRYEQLRAEADSIFGQMSEKFPQCVTCSKGCSDCCHALFDLSLVEAMYINQAFKAAFDYGAQRSEILTRAATTDRKLTKYKRELFHMEKNGESEAAIMAKAAQIRIPCPLLDDNSCCLLYEARPITCRLYGVPTVIKNQGHVCGFSNFSLGNKYPTVHLDKIQARLEALSAEIATTVHSRFTELDQVYVPLSMALLTEYNEQYLGIGPARED